MNRRALPFIAAGLLVLGGAGLTRASLAQQATPTAPETNLVTVGWGDKDFAANIFTPQEIHVYAGDTVTFRNNGALEPHTVTFGDLKTLMNLAPENVIPVKNGPPIVAMNPKVFYPTQGRTYSGGFANSGLIFKGQSWSLTFTKPGSYHYYCLLHYDPSPNGSKMDGLVVVAPRPAASHLYTVTSGYNSRDSVADAFVPRHLTIHAGDSVQWTPGFHTVAFGPDALRKSLEANLLIRQRTDKGESVLAYNPRVIFPSGGNVYSGSGFLNSGIMLPVDPNAKPKPFTVTFTRPGTYEYDCLIHPGMDGTITVLP